MATKLYSFFLVFLISFIAVLNFFAYKFHWYWEYWWFDMVMHTLGGIWVSSAALWWRYFKNPPTEKILLSKRYLFLFSLAAVSIIGICWELFEFSLDKFITFNINDPWDTASDLFFDGVGSVLAVFLFRAVYNKVSTIKITEINN